jgi:hypothetical protein
LVLDYRTPAIIGRAPVDDPTIIMTRRPARGDDVTMPVPSAWRRDPHDPPWVGDLVAKALERWWALVGLNH